MKRTERKKRVKQRIEAVQHSCHDHRHWRDFDFRKEKDQKLRMVEEQKKEDE